MLTGDSFEKAMADSASAASTEGAPAEGELSKNQLKKLAKAKEAAEKKAAKVAAAAEKAATEGPKKGKIGGDDEELDPTKYYENRMNSLAKHSVRASTSLKSYLNCRVSVLMQWSNLLCFTVVMICFAYLDDL